MSDALEARSARFRELHSNPWFPVMNWVLDQLRMPKDDQWRSVMNCGFYFDKREIPKKHWVYNYNAMW